MAPTEILARQHFERLAPLLENAGLRLALLTGRAKPIRARGAARAHRRAARSTSSSAPMRWSQSDLAFHDLGLAVVDEQHRFGVQQRLALGAKGEAVDVLVMTATPIPRSLALTYFGDMDCPSRRKAARPHASRYAHAAGCRGSARWWRACSARLAPARASIGCARWSRRTRISISPPRRIATRIYEEFFGEVVGLVHGRMKGAGEGRGDGGLQGRRDAHSRRHHGDRSRRRCAARRRSW